LPEDEECYSTSWQLVERVVTVDEALLGAEEDDLVDNWVAFDGSPLD